MDVTPDKQNIDKLFSNTTYYIDFYQRQYKWDEDPVRRLLDDIFYRFNQQYAIFKDKEIPLPQLIEKYSWYYLSTYVTNSIGGKTYVVDGQQRLTTITLILMKLKHMSKNFNSALSDWIAGKIAGTSGFNKQFWMNHEQHTQTLLEILDGKALESIDVSPGITSVNLVQNFRVVSKILDTELSDKSKFEAFVFFFLHRVVLISLNVEQTDVPMVFEVINDRGIRLRSHEILKGKLLGQIDKDELDALRFNEFWDETVKSINGPAGEDGVDAFFGY